MSKAHIDPDDRSQLHTTAISASGWSMVIDHWSLSASVKYNTIQKKGKLMQHNPIFLRTAMNSKKICILGEGSKLHFRVVFPGYNLTGSF